MLAQRALYSLSICGHHTWNRADATAITTTMLHLCSAPCKALRFAPTAHARGLRALTVPPRRRSAGNYVMAVACSFRPEHTAHRSIHWTALRSARACSIVSGHVRFTRLLRFIFRDFDR